MFLHLFVMCSPAAERGLVYFSWKLKLWGDQRKCEDEYSWMNEISDVCTSVEKVLSNIWKAVLYYEVDFVQGASFEILSF